MVIEMKRFTLILILLTLCASTAFAAGPPSSPGLCVAPIPYNATTWDVQYANCYAPAGAVRDVVEVGTLSLRTATGQRLPLTGTSNMTGQRSGYKLVTERRRRSSTTTRPTQILLPVNPCFLKTLLSVQTVMSLALTAVWEWICVSDSVSGYQAVQSR